MKKTIMKISMSITLALLCTGIRAQHKNGELPYHQIYAYGMDADVSPILTLLDESDGLEGEDLAFKESFERRFKGAEDSENYSSTGDEQIDKLLEIFRRYWRKSLLDPSQNYMMDLGKEVMPFLIKNYPLFKSPSQRDSLGNYLADYIRSRGYYTTKQVNPTGKLVDLLIWRNQADSVFNVQLSKSETIDVNVIMMDEFLTLGWMEYATLGEHHAGGWTTEDALYCVKKSYDLDSENFRVSYLAHEARHFADKKVFKDLSDKDLEYRSKLTELSLAQKSIFHLIEFFINNANEESDNGHQLANHQLIADLSKSIFNKDYESSIEAWREVKVKKINKAANELLNQHTRKLESS